MALRTILSPGVEITERDLSDYITGTVGTGVLVIGFAAHGRDYEPQIITTRSSWLIQFGEPTNEAERYFFNACMEVINQGGRLYACKLPYKNDALNKFVAQKYFVNVGEATDEDAITVQSVAEYIRKHHIDTELLPGNFFQYRSVPGKQSDFAKIKWAADILKEFDNAIDRCTEAVPYVYASDELLGILNTQETELDNWLRLSVGFVYRKLLALFDPSSKIRQYIEGSSGTGIPFDDSAFEAVFVKHADELDGVSYSEATPEDFAKAFALMYEDVFGPAGTQKFENTLNPVDATWKTLTQYEFAEEYDGSDLQKFITDNEDFFNKLYEITDQTPWQNQGYAKGVFSLDGEDFDNLLPFVYVGQNNCNKCNLGSYYKAVVSNPEIAAAYKTINTTPLCKLTNIVINVDEYLREDVESGVPRGGKDANVLKDVVETIMKSSVVPGAGKLWEEGEAMDDSDSRDIETLRDYLAQKPKNEDGEVISVSERICNVIDALDAFMNTDYFKENFPKISDEQYSATQFAKKALKYYSDRTLIPGVKDKKNIVLADDFNQFFEVFYNETTGEDEDEAIAGETFFTVYNKENSGSGELNEVSAVVDKTVDTVTYEELMSYVDEFSPDGEFGFLYDFTDTHTELKEALEALNKDKIAAALKYGEIASADPTLKRFLRILPEGGPSTIDIEEIDGYATGEIPVNKNHFIIIDKTRSALKKAYARDEEGNEKQVVGIIPIITSAANALYAQSLLEVNDDDVLKYQSVENALTIKTNSNKNGFTFDVDVDLGVKLASNKNDEYTISKIAAQSFPNIFYKADGSLDRQYMKNIGVIVAKAYLDPGEGNLVNFDIVEAFSGTLNKDDTDPITGATTFIDKIVNSNSDYIEFYSNCFNDSTEKLYKKTDFFVVPTHTAGNLGFYGEMTKKNISIADSITKALPLIWEKNEDINEKEIDIVVDAGISNIAQYIKSVFGKEGEYDPTSTNASLFKLRSKADTLTWRGIIDMFDNFCKNHRKDCMFIADGPRPLCLVGDKKIVRPSKPTNTIDNTVIPMVKYITGINSNYGAGYCNWFQKVDQFSGDTFWCPPSIQAMGAYIDTDLRWDYWMAPAGFKRGVVSAVDVAFNPTQKHADEIYPKCWNYARQYPTEGIDKEQDFRRCLLFLVNAQTPLRTEPHLWRKQ